MLFLEYYFPHFGSCASRNTTHARDLAADQSYGTMLSYCTITFFIEQNRKICHLGCMKTAAVIRPTAALTALLAAILSGHAILAEPHSIAAPDPEAARFAPCEGSVRVTCVVDGDTFWYRGLKIRIADINAPELGHPSCAYEAQLAETATRRLTDLLNAGPFILAVEGRETDRYGRALRVVLRRGRSLGKVLEREGLAEHWQGRRGDWCAA